jgi:hypothetical protein
MCVCERVSVREYVCVREFSLSLSLSQTDTVPTHHLLTPQPFSLSLFERDLGSASGDIALKDSCRHIATIGGLQKTQRFNIARPLFLFFISFYCLTYNVTLR